MCPSSETLGRRAELVESRARSLERAIRICAINLPLNLRDLDIHYRNGGHEDVRTRALLRAGACTRAIDLRGGSRDIERIRLRYSPIYRFAQRPYVRVQVR